MQLYLTHKSLSKKINWYIHLLENIRISASFFVRCASGGNYEKHVLRNHISGQLTQVNQCNFILMSNKIYVISTLTYKRALSKFVIGRYIDITLLHSFFTKVISSLHYSCI